ncbi:MAG: hypothetical protein HY735_35055 [Verrucomicrobia bacterium]|nr:hypothetical protein [Verrucomicrobiota bacterium]
MQAVIENLLKLQDTELQTRRKVPDRDAIVAELRGKIPEPILAHYDRLRARDKKGVALLRHNVCTECHMQVPIGVVLTLMQGKDIQLCSNCGRYLYLPKEESPSAEPPPVPPKPKRKKRNLTETADVQ